MAKRFGVLLVSAILVVGMAFAMVGCSSSTYEPKDKQATLSPPNIGKAGVLRVGVDANNAPFAGQSSGKISGLDVDIAAAIADELGLNLEIVDIGSDADGSLKDNSVDIVMGVDKSSSSLECWKSDAYIESAVALFAPSESAAVPTKDSKPKIAAQTSSMSAWEVTNQFGSDATVPTSDLKTAFTQLGTGSTVDYVAADAVIGSYAAQISGSTASIIALLEKPSGYCVGVNKENTALQTAIENTLENLVDNGIINVIESKWLGSPIDLADVPLTAAAKTEDEKESTEKKTEEGGEADADATAEGDQSAAADGTETNTESTANSALDDDTDDAVVDDPTLEDEV